MSIQQEVQKLALYGSIQGLEIMKFINEFTVDFDNVVVIVNVGVVVVF